MRVLLLHNPGAGDEGGGDELCSVIERAGHDVLYSSLDEDWKPPLDRPVDLVAIAGGDGAVGEVLAELATRPRPLLATILPVGSANNIATSLGLSSRTAEVLVSGWSSARRARYDLGEPGPFVESAGVGLFTLLVERASGGPSGEDKVEHGLTLLRELVEDAPTETRRILLDGSERSGAYLAVEAMLIGMLGPNVPLAPLADPCDGFFDVVLVGEADRKGLASYLDDRLAGRATRPPRLEVERARQVLIEPAGLLRVDDETRDEGATACLSTGRLTAELLIPTA